VGSAPPRRRAPVPPGRFPVAHGSSRAGLAAPARLRDRQHAALSVHTALAGACGGSCAGVARSPRSAVRGPICRAYLLKARKRVHAITPIRPVWQKKPQLVGGLAKPTSRSAA
jgi:hypothetical protein